MNWLNRLNTALILAVSISIAGCSSVPARVNAAQHGDGDFYVEDQNVRGFARLTPEGYLEIIENRALTTRDVRSVYAPGTDFFQLYISALGGLEAGEIKRIPQYNGLAFMTRDGTIVVNYVIHGYQGDGGGGDPIISPLPRSFSYPPSDPSYPVFMEMYRVRKPGDGYFITRQ